MRQRLHRVVHLGFIAGVIAFVAVRVSHASVPTIWDMGIGLAVGLATTFLLSLTRLGDE